MNWLKNRERKAMRIVWNKFFFSCFYDKVSFKTLNKRRQKASSSTYPCIIRIHNGLFVLNGFFFGFFRDSLWENSFSYEILFIKEIRHSLEYIRRRRFSVFWFFCSSFDFKEFSLWKNDRNLIFFQKLRNDMRKFYNL